MIQRHGQVTSVAGKIRRMYAKKAIPDGEYSLVVIRLNNLIRTFDV